MAITVPLSTGERLRLVRERRRLDQQQLADASGVSRATIVRIEGDRLEPTLTTLRKLGGALEVDPAWLACYSDDPVRPVP